MTIPLRSRRTAKPCPFKAFRSPLTPAVSALARHSLNPFPFYLFPATGGGTLVIPTRKAAATQERRAGPSATLRRGGGYTITRRARPFGRTQGKHIVPLQARGALAVSAGRWALATDRCCSPLSDTSRQYCVAIALGLTGTESIRIPARSGSPRCGYVVFVHRCPNAHH